MSHHIYHTQAIVISSRNYGEANKILTLYTRELGLIRAVVQGIRLSKSKLRFALADYSLARVDLVKGREVWRVTSATYVKSFGSLTQTIPGVSILSHTVKLLERLLPGEDPHENIFDDVVTAYEYLTLHNDKREFFEVTELCLVLRILKSLGYISTKEEYKTHVEGVFDPSMIAFDTLPKKTIIFEINRALRESQL
jgi:DNA repair protein RecO (recombination protein O)